jgi:hypothetical protein
MAAGRLLPMRNRLTFQARNIAHSSLGDARHNEHNAHIFRNYRRGDGRSVDHMGSIGCNTES